MSDERINSEIYVFADRSKCGTGTRAGFFCSNPYTKGSFKLNDYNSVFKPEIAGVIAGVKWAFVLTSPLNF